MAADSSPTTPLPRAGDATPAGTEEVQPASFAALFVQDLPKLPSLAALRALTDHELPSTDGLPMPESMVQGPPMRYTVSALDWLFKARRPGTCVAGDLLVYSEGRPDANGRVRPETAAPDVLVAFGVGERLRDSYVMWREEKPPDFVMEIASESTWKRTGTRSRPGTRDWGWGSTFCTTRWVAAWSRGCRGMRCAGAGTGGCGRSVSGTARRGVQPGARSCAWLQGPRQELRWYDPVTGRDLEDYDEAKAGRDAAEERARAAEAEIAALRAQVRRLEGGPRP